METKEIKTYRDWEAIEDQVMDLIMKKLGVTRWTVRVQRALDYFRNHPDEISHLDEYYLHTTRDPRYLLRKNRNRVGVCVGAQTFGFVFLARDTE